jgi:multidrug efflux pump subunit AcrA (membrane-fusion protein)
MTRTATARDTARAEVRLLRTRLQQMTLTAPMAGVVSQRLVEAGDATPKHAHLLTLIDPTRLVTDVDVSELALPNLRVGDAAQVRIDALGAASHPAAFCAFIQRWTRPPAAAASKSCWNRCRRARDRASSAASASPPASRSAWWYRWRRCNAMSMASSSSSIATMARCTASAVRSGLRLADRVEIIDGLEADARVVVKGFLELAAGRKVKPIDAKPADVKANAKPAAAE